MQVYDKKPTDDPLRPFNQFHNERFKALTDHHPSLVTPAKTKLIFYEWCNPKK